MLKVTGPVGTRTFRVLWLLEELGLDYEHSVERPWSDAVRALNPLGQVPILQDGDVVLTDSLAIMHYLADRAGKLTHPGGTAERAHMDARINFVLTEMEAPLWVTSKHKYVLPEDLRRPEALPAAREEFFRAEEKFARLLGPHPFIAGDDFTVADIVAGHVASWALSAKFGHRTREMADYFARMSARPAWTRARKEQA